MAMGSILTKNKLMTFISYAVIISKGKRVTVNTIGSIEKLICQGNVIL